MEYDFIDNKSDPAFFSLGQNRQKCEETVVKGICKLESIVYQPVESAHQEPLLLRKKDAGEKVKQIQNHLLTLEYSLGPYGPDGIFGEQTGKVLLQSPKKYGLLQDGIVGTQT